MSAGAPAGRSRPAGAGPGRPSAAPPSDAASIDLARYLPHRAPMLLVDRILAVGPGGVIAAEKRVRPDDPFLDGHFPGQPVFPGALLLEGLAQCSLVLFQVAQGLLAPGEVGVFGGAAGRFLGPVFPGDTLVYRVEAVKMTSTGGVFRGRATVGERLVARGEMTMARARYDALRKGPGSGATGRAGEGPAGAGKGGR